MAELTGRSIAHTPSHFIPLSSWLRESNYFHLLRAIRFFRTYLAAKVFRLWRANVRDRRLACSSPRLPLTHLPAQDPRPIPAHLTTYSQRADRR